MSERGVDVSDAAREFGTYPNMVWRMLSGHRAITPAEILKWATFLDVPLLVAWRRFGFDVPNSTVPVIGLVRETGRVSVLPPDQQSRVEAPTDASGDMLALRVEAPQSRLAIYDGAHLYYEPSDVVRPDAFGRLAVIELGDHSAPLVGVLDRASIGRGRVIVFGGAETVESSQLVSAAPVRWQRAG